MPSELTLPSRPSESNLLDISATEEGLVVPEPELVGGALPPIIAADMAGLRALLREGLAPRGFGYGYGSAAAVGHGSAGGPRQRPRGGMRILNLACGRCDEAGTLLGVARELTGGGPVEMVGADIRIREIRQAREQHAKLPAEFLLADAAQLGRHKELGQDFDMVFLRHQNFWHGSELWKRIFDQGIRHLRPDGLLVITSYFDLEHRLALEALRALGMEVVSNKRNGASRALTDAVGKSVDRWVAVLRRRV